MRGELIPMELHCPRCEHIERCGSDAMLARLQQCGVLRRTKEPELDLIQELFAATADRYVCAQCSAVGLSLREASADEWDEWDTAQHCEACGEAIPRERLEVFPDAELCATCQQKDDVGAADEVEYCPRCGDIMTTRLVRRGTSQYVMACPSCGAKT